MEFMKILKIVQFLVLIFCCVFHIHQFIEDDIIKRSVDEWDTAPVDVANTQWNTELQAFPTTAGFVHQPYQ